MVEVKGLSKKYGDRYAVSGLDFTIEKGHVYGFLGPNGAGKTTTMNMITGCLAPTEGSISIFGNDIVDAPLKAKSYIGYLPEIPPLYSDMSPREFLSFVASAKGIKGSEVKNEVNRVLSETQIASPYSERLIKYLSKGYKQRVGIASAMLGSPELLIFDEPTVGLDPKQIIDIRNLIKELGKTSTVILSSHILSEIEEVCDRIIIINNGEIVACDTLDNLKQSYLGYDILTVESPSDSEKVLSLLSSVEAVLCVDHDDESGVYTLKVDKEKDCREEIFIRFYESGLTLLGMTRKVVTLEDVFLSATDSDEEYDDEDEDEDCEEDEETDDSHSDDGSHSDEEDGTDGGFTDEELMARRENPGLLSIESLSRRVANAKKKKEKDNSSDDEYDPDYDYENEPSQKGDTK